MSCSHRSQASDFLDGVLEPTAARAFEAHLVDCPACAATLGDLRSIIATARVLERHAVPPTLWNRIEHRLHAAPSARAGGVETWRLFGWRQLATAAALLLVVGGASWLAWQLISVAPGTRMATDVASNQPDPVLVLSVETQLNLAEEHYSNAIAGLDAIAKAEDSALDPQTAELLQANLSVIDIAIGESRAALQADPSNPLARESLFSALQSKVSLLQNTISLINEMRKGNDAEAARIVSGMNP